MKQKFYWIFGIIFILTIILIIGCVQQIEKPKEKPPIIVRGFAGMGLIDIKCTDKNYLSENSDVILVGTVEKKETEVETVISTIYDIRENKNKTVEGKAIYTLTTVLIDKFNKGSLDSDRIIIKTPGGTVGDVIEDVTDLPQFVEGKTLLIYLKEYDGKYQVFCASEGVKVIS